MFTTNMRRSHPIPQSFNRYAYTQNDPVNFTDPSGLQPCVGAECGWGGFGGWGGGWDFNDRGSAGSKIIGDAWADRSDPRVIVRNSNYEDADGNLYFFHTLVTFGPQNSDSYVGALDKAFTRVEGIFKKKPDSKCANFFGPDALTVLEAMRDVAVITAVSIRVFRSQCM